MDDATPAKGLAWRIPSPEEIAARRRGRWQGIFAGLACAIVVVVSFQADQRAAGLIAVAAIAAGLFFWTNRRRAPLPPNVRLDLNGFHWHSETGRWTLPRGDVTAFRVEPEENDRGLVLVFLLRGDFDSQPIWIGGAEEAERVRRYLLERWSLDEQPSPVTSVSPAIAVRLPIYSECHPENSEWHLEGAPAAVRGFAAAIRRAADELPLPPLGARPKAAEILGERRTDSYVLIERTQDSTPGWFDDDRICGPRDFLHAVADRLTSAVESGKTDVTLEIDSLDGVWTFTLHVDE